MILRDQLMRYMIYKIKIYAQQDVISLFCNVTVLGNCCSVPDEGELERSVYSLLE